jgi:hypothetical protein
MATKDIIGVLIRGTEKIAQKLGVDRSTLTRYASRRVDPLPLV